MKFSFAKKSVGLVNVRERGQGVIKVWRRSKKKNGNFWEGERRGV